MIGAVAALLTAAAGLATTLVSSKPTGRPWKVGVATLAIVGAVLLVVALISDPPDADNSTPDQARKLYQNRVVSICTDDRESELKFKRQMAQMQPDMMSGDLSVMYSIPKLMTDAIVEVQGLADRLEALDPPADLEPIQSETVSTWRRGIAVSRENRDKVLKLAETYPGDPVKFAEELTHLDYKEETRLESQKDVLLRRLGGPGCLPSP